MSTATAEKIADAHACTCKAGSARKRSAHERTCAGSGAPKAGWRARVPAFMHDELNRALYGLPDETPVFRALALGRAQGTGFPAGALR